MTRPVDLNGGAPAPGPGEPGVKPKPGHGDHLKNKSSGESEFQKSFTPGAVPLAPVKLGSKEYDRDLWDSPMVRTLKRALAGWEVPPAGSGLKLGRVLKDDDPRLKPTDGLPGREVWRAALQKLVVSAGAVQLKPTAYYLAGPMGVGKVAMTRRLSEQGALPDAVVKADADYLHHLVPEMSELEALGDGRGGDVVHEEASTIGREAYFQALAEKRDVVHNSMMGTPAHFERMTKAKDAGFKRVVLALVSTLDVAKQRAGADGVVFSEKTLVASHRDFSRGFDDLLKNADELVLLSNTGTRIEVIAQGKAGELTVKDERAYAAFRAQQNLTTDGLT